MKVNCFCLQHYLSVASRMAHVYFVILVWFQDTITWRNQTLITHPSVVERHKHSEPQADHNSVEKGFGSQRPVPLEVPYLLPAERISPSSDLQDQRIPKHLWTSLVYFTHNVHPNGENYRNWIYLCPKSLLNRLKRHWTMVLDPLIKIYLPCPSFQASSSSAISTFTVHAFGVLVNMHLSESLLPNIDLYIDIYSI